MAHATPPVSSTEVNPGGPGREAATGGSREDLETLIHDTIVMIANTRSFLDRLDHSQVASRETVAQTCKRLDDALASLRRRQRSLTGDDC